ncbi:hypothetical protein ACOJBM_01920 [Rhizobium beringeri]
MGKIANPVTIKTFLKADEKIGDMTVSQYLASLVSNAVTVINAEITVGRSTTWRCAGR